MFERITQSVAPFGKTAAKTAPQTAPVVYQSTLLRKAGVLHSFSTRQAGDQPVAPSAATGYESEWDLAIASDSTTGQPTHGYQLLLQAAGCSDLPMVHVNQVHGNRVLLVDITDATLNHPPATDRSSAEQTSTSPSPLPSSQAVPEAADGLVTATPGMALSIRVADCVPVLLAALIDGKPLVVAAVHAGWRGLVEGIIPEAVRTIHQKIEELAAQAKARQNPEKTEDTQDATAVTVQIIAAIGPCISAKHYEVGEQVADAFADANLDAAIIQTPGQKPHINLPLAAKLQLLASGLLEADIDPGTLCTFDNQADFFSHRRDHGQTGRLAAMIALKPVEQSVEPA